MAIITHPACVTYEMPGHPEAPFRVRDTVAHLTTTDLAIQWVEAVPAPKAAVLLAHEPEHLDHLEAEIDAFDGDTPRYPQIDQHAKRAAGAALQALEMVRENASTPPFSLMRPPGHHATQDRAMGFCYLNHVAIAALSALQNGYERVAVYDFDVHHGNGTEAILHAVEGASFYSIHQHPCYPGTGTHSFDNCHNYPVPPHGPRQRHRDACAKAMETMLSEKPELIIVSAGFDAYEQDPLAQGTFTVEDYHWLGEELRRSTIPFFSVLEGGYSRDLPKLIEAYLRGTGA